MPQKPTAVQMYPTDNIMQGWLRAYIRFLTSKDESFVLKIAPLALMGVMPIDVISNLIPGIGLLDDAGYIVIAVTVLFKTLARVNYYRRSSPPPRAVVTQ